MKRIAVVGLGYVGLGLAIELSKKHSVVGYDISTQRIAELADHWDRNNLINADTLANASLVFTAHSDGIKEATIYIVAVSTPAYFYQLPNLEPLVGATETVAGVLKVGDTVIFESTVYPGTTEEICLPILEKISQLRSGIDFGIGYSPERISSGDLEKNLKNIVKVVSGQNPQVLKVVKELYETVCDSVCPVSSLATAEAVKLLENSQRDVNIAFMNEFAQIMHTLDLNVHEIIEAAKTKWSFVPFKPGFVGGHCIAVDPHYLIFKAKRAGYHPDLLLAARKINDGMPQFVVQEVMKLFIKNDLNITKAKIGVFGLTYKENTPDLRNSLALKLVQVLKSAGFNYQVHDPVADKQVVLDRYQLKLDELEDMNDLAIAIMVVGHDFYLQQGAHEITTRLQHPKLLMDIPNMFASVRLDYDVTYWSL